MTLRTLLTATLALVLAPFAAPTALAAAPTDADIYQRLDRLDVAPAALRTDVARACNVLSTKVFFGEGATSLEIHDEAVLSGVANCLATGALANADIVVVGYTDPLGDEATNMLIARERAESVERFFTERVGLDADRFHVVSAGEATVSPYDGYDFAMDRRVELWVLPR